MNLPNYSPHPLLFQGNFYNGRDISQETYCYATIEAGGKTFSRYITPNGWSKNVHYFPSQKEAEIAFNKFGQEEIPHVQEYEIIQRIHDEDYYREMREEEFERYMEEWLGKNTELAEC